MSSNTPTTMIMSKTLALGAGSYWGTEKFIVVDFQKRFPNSIEKAEVGFMSSSPRSCQRYMPIEEEPTTYHQVCTEITSYVEVLNVTLKDETLTEELLRFFFMFHDASTLNRQGNDVGTQYASVIFCSDDAQKAIANRVKDDLQIAFSSGTMTSYQRGTVETKILSYSPFVKAHEEHQAYLRKNPRGYCNHYLRFQEWPIVANNNRHSSKGYSMKKRFKAMTHKRRSRKFTASFAKILLCLSTNETTPPA